MVPDDRFGRAATDWVAIGWRHSNGPNVERRLACVQVPGLGLLGRLCIGDREVLPGSVNALLTANLWAVSHVTVVAART